MAADIGSDAEGNVASGATKFAPKAISIGSHLFDIELNFVDESGVKLEQDDDDVDETTVSYLQVMGTDRISKDTFERIFSVKELQSMNWPNNSILSEKQFLASVLFEPDDGMSFEMGFIATDDIDIKSNDDNDNDNNDNDSKKEEIVLTPANYKYDRKNINQLMSKDYNGSENELMIIKLQFANKWFNQKWILELPFKPQNEVGKLRLMIEDLRQELKTVTQNLSSFKGVILMWSGQIDDIPNGWQLCDGTNGTPNLTDRFIIGAGDNSDMEVGDIGGDKSHSHHVTVRPHTLTIAEMPAHTHDIAMGDYCDGASKYRTVHTSGEWKTTTSTGGNQPHSHGSTCTNVSHIPPYYALAFIIRL